MKYFQDEYFTFEELSEIIDAPRNNQEYIGEAFDENIILNPNYGFN